MRISDWSSDVCSSDLAALDKAKLDLERTEVRTPIDGVASKVPDVGGYVLPGLPVISVVDAKGPWAAANLKDSPLERVRPGPTVTVDVDEIGSAPGSDRVCQSV